MVFYLIRKSNNYVHRLNSFQLVQGVFFAICITFIGMQYLCMQVFLKDKMPAPITTRLDQNRPLTIDLRSYEVCHPNEFYLENLTLKYREIFPNEDDVCFLIEDLNGGSWWTYISQEFAEILGQLKNLSQQSNINYRSFSIDKDIDSNFNLTQTFLNTCQINDRSPRQEQKLMIILLWNIDRRPWTQYRSQWLYLQESTRMRLLVFIDDLHYENAYVYQSRQFLFEFIATEIFSTYPYLFHNYYSNISHEKITWLPHAASISSYRSVNRSSEDRLFVSGVNMHDWYPCRFRAFQLCRTRPDLAACLQHPGYSLVTPNPKLFHYGAQQYSIYMRQFTFGLATCQSVQYAIGKLFELPANGLVLVTTNDLVPILEKLHLNNNTHFRTIKCFKKSLPDEIRYLKNLSKAELFSIRKSSQDIIFQRHLTIHRAQLLHIRLLAQALLASSPSANESTQWRIRGKMCHALSF